MRRPWIAGLALLLAGCAGALGEVEPPEVSLAGLALGRPGLFEQQLRLDLRLRNPNDVDLHVERVRFAFEVNGEPFGRGWTTEDFELPAFGETVVPVTVTVPTNDLIERIMQLGAAERLDYRLKGEAKLGNFALGWLPFEREGRLELPRIPGAKRPST